MGLGPVVAKPKASSLGGPTIDDGDDDEEEAGGGRDCDDEDGGIAAGGYTVVFILSMSSAIFSFVDLDAMVENVRVGWCWCWSVCVNRLDCVVVGKNGRCTRTFRE